MSDHKAVLRKHIQLLDAVVNHPKVNIKFYETLIEYLTYTAGMAPHDPLRELRLNRVRLTEAGMDDILTGHKQIEKCGDRDIINLRDRIFERQGELAQHRKVMTERVVNPLMNITYRISRDYDKTHRYTAWFLPHQWIKRKTLHKLAKSSKLLFEGFNKGKMSSVQDTLKLMKSLLVRPALKLSGTFTWFKKLWRQSNDRPEKNKDRSETYLELKHNYHIVELGYKVATYYEKGYQTALDELEGKTTQSLTGPKAGRRECTLAERQLFF